MNVNLVSVTEDIEKEDHVAVLSQEQQVCRVLQQDEGYWIFHKNKVDLTSVFSHPEEKLWLVVKEQWRPTLHSDGNAINTSGDDYGQKRGIKLQKNSVIKLGRVRLRVRDIDYGDDHQ